jgi:hypothetical protein
MADNYTCPVCQYPGLSARPYATWPPPANLEIRPPYEDWLGAPSYEVCPRCGFEFGNDDNPGTAEPLSFETYRAQWKREGCRVFDPALIAARSRHHATTQG